MKQPLLILFVCLSTFLGTTGAIPMPPPPPSTSSKHGTTAGSTSSEPANYPTVTRVELNNVCEETKKFTLPMIKGFETAFKKMPDERGITDQIAYFIHKSNAGQVVFHSQVAEGKSGTDFLIEMHFKDDPDLTEESLTSELSALSVGREGSGAENKQPQGGITRSRTPVQTEKGSTSAGASGSGSSSSKKAQDRIVYIQAKSYKGEERTADFTYQRKHKDKTQPEPELQMKLLEKTVKEAEADPKNKNAVVVGGYLLYDPEEIVFIPLNEIIEECGENCKGNSAELNKLMSNHFREKYGKKAGKKETCFMVDLATAPKTTIKSK